MKKKTEKKKTNRPKQYEKKLTTDLSFEEIISKALKTPPIKRGANTSSKMD